MNWVSGCWWSTKISTKRCPWIWQCEGHGYTWTKAGAMGREMNGWLEKAQGTMEREKVKIKISTLEFCCKGEWDWGGSERERTSKGFSKTMEAVPTCSYFDGNNFVERGKLVMRESGTVTQMKSLNCQEEKLTLVKSLLNPSTLNRGPRRHIPRTTSKTNRIYCIVEKTQTPKQSTHTPSKRIHPFWKYHLQRHMQK